MDANALMDELYKPKTIRQLARKFQITEWAIAHKHLKPLVRAGLVEEGPERPKLEGSICEPPKSYVLKRTKRV